MNDLISRKALQREIENLYDLNYGERLIDPREFYEMVDNQNGTYANKWIPVSERLPKEDGNYLVTMKHKEFNQTKVTSMDFNGEFLFNDYFEKAWWEVTAWQPLPEPWKERQE